ncbi:ribonuclease E inhibitor RraA/Dimethylmenaquinone methyltransferase [Lophiotrema nucula]|uniref:Ribonuclease E inhibitor RraA/Dimethylmenaquinone methyltransferase n=1 Tax=Lophiotrema nucula TaxID=690887 RepID=A0A6A5ZJZ2_9PLEO|nr:ribonuclease E inhibitor RraA/Dimethylmenaquinone methyltransferase [Lophiotrema nucula]
MSIWSPVRQGHMGSSSAAVIGEATTVKMVDAKDKSAPTPSKHFADSAEVEKIMYIQQPHDMYSACFGGLMASRLKKIGAAGVVIDGRFRDIKEIQGIGLPLFARGNSILGSNTFTRASQLNVPVHFRGDLWINPGDIIVGDQDGVVVVPPSLVDQVAQLCAERKEIDEKTMKDLEDGFEIGPTIQKHRR